MTESYVTLEDYQRIRAENKRLREENKRLLSNPGHNTAGKATTGRSGSRESKLAALRFLPKSGTKRRLVMDVIASEYPYGLSDEQIHRRVGGDIRSINARRKELEEGGWVVKGDSIVSKKTGHTVATWKLSETGLERRTPA